MANKLLCRYALRTVLDILLTQREHSHHWMPQADPDGVLLGGCLKLGKKEKNTKKPKHSYKRDCPWLWHSPLFSTFSFFCFIFIFLYFLYVLQILLLGLQLMGSINHTSSQERYLKTIIYINFTSCKASNPTTKDKLLFYSLSK